MPDPADLFPGFGARFLSKKAGRLLAGVGESGPPLASLARHDRGAPGKQIDAGYFVTGADPDATPREPRAML